MLETLDDAAVHRWCGGGLAALRAHQHEIDELNVYPVPDGDTGTNLVLTLTSAQEALDAREADAARPALSGEVLAPEPAQTPLGRAMRRMARGALLGARGNSGVIVSQILRGMAEEFAGAVAVRGGELARALRSASEAAYAAVARPVEGTVLSVVAAAADAAGKVRSDDLLAVARAASRAATEALARTPQQLPVLARAGVVDAGGRGLCLLLDALVEALSTNAPPPAAASSADFSPSSPSSTSASSSSSSSASSASGPASSFPSSTSASAPASSSSSSDPASSSPSPASAFASPSSASAPGLAFSPAMAGQSTESAEDEAEVARLSALGAKLIDDQRLPDGGGWVEGEARAEEGEAPAPPAPPGSTPISPGSDRVSPDWDPVDLEPSILRIPAAAPTPPTNQGEIDYGYEVQYLLDAEPAAVDRLKTQLDALGDSLVVVGTGEGDPPTWNVHVHVADIGAAIEAGVDAGRPHRISVTRLVDHRHGHHPAATAGPALPDARGAVVVAAGDGLTALFAAEGAVVVDRNPSIAEMLDAIAATRAGRVVLLPNDANTHAVAVSAAREAAHTGVRVSVVPTRSPVQALAALAVRDPQRRFSDDVIAMAEAAGACRYGEVCTAQREALTVAGRCRPGDLLGLVDGEVHIIGGDLHEVSRRLLDRMLGGGGELATLVLGADAPPTLEATLRGHMGQTWPFVELQCYTGGQPRYHLLVGVE